MQKKLQGDVFSPGCIVSQSPTLLWVNLTSVPGPTPLSCQFEKYFTINPLCSKLVAHTSHDKADFICFEYDYPDCDSLKILKQTRELYPSTPTIMFTVQHSEELAIWALRNRVWDYYYKPISKQCLSELAREISCCHSHVRNKSQPDNRYIIHSRYPDEVRFKDFDDDQLIIDIALNYLHLHYNEKIFEKTLSDLCDMSRFQFTRRFKKVVGATFQAYLLAYRIEKAKIMLQNPSARIHDIAYIVGFSDPAYFTRVFKRLVGVCPSVYRDKNL